MKQKDMDKLISHFDISFQQSDCLIMHPIADNGLHIDMLLYEPNEKYPFWKLVTMGASDYKMPKYPHSLSRFNEYMMFIDREVDMKDKSVACWYYNKLRMIASYAYNNKSYISYGHSFEWSNEDPDDEMIAAFIEFPQAIETVSILRCKMDMFRTVACLQVVLLNSDDLRRMMEIGPQAFSEYLYPDGDGKTHFLSERHRSEKF